MNSLKLEEMSEKIAAHFAEVEKARETSYDLHRKIIKKSSITIRTVHRGEKEEAKKILEETRELIEEANRAIAEFEELPRMGFIFDAQKEFAEASGTYAIIFGEELPGPDELHISYAAYLNGLSEVIGELRRKMLDLMRQDKGDEGEVFLDAMEEIYSVLVTMDFSDAVTGKLRHSTDQARGIYERTRGDFTNHIVSRRLRNEMDRHLEEWKLEVRS